MCTFDCSKIENKFRILFFITSNFVQMKKIFLLCALLPVFANAQLVFRLNDTSPVTQYGNSLSMPWTGGINFPQWSEVDINNDGLKDLFMFDRSNNRVMVLKNTGGANPNTFQFVDSF